MLAAKTAAELEGALEERLSFGRAAAVVQKTGEIVECVADVRMFSKQSLAHGERLAEIPLGVLQVVQSDLNRRQIMERQREIRAAIGRDAATDRNATQEERASNLEIAANKVQMSEIVQCLSQRGMVASTKRFAHRNRPLVELLRLLASAGRGDNRSQVVQTLGRIRVIVRQEFFMSRQRLPAKPDCLVVTGRLKEQHAQVALAGCDIDVVRTVCSLERSERFALNLHCAVRRPACAKHGGVVRQRDGRVGRIGLSAIGFERALVVLLGFIESALIEQDDRQPGTAGRGAGMSGAKASRPNAKRVAKVLFSDSETAFAAAQLSQVLQAGCNRGVVFGKRPPANRERSFKQASGRFKSPKVLIHVANGVHDCGLDDRALAELTLHALGAALEELAGGRIDSRAETAARRGEGIGRAEEFGQKCRDLP